MPTIQQVQKETTWGEASSVINSNFAMLNARVETINTEMQVPWFFTLNDLNTYIKMPYLGQMAAVGQRDAFPLPIYRFDGDEWQTTELQIEAPSISLVEYYTKDEVDAKLNDFGENTIDISNSWEVLDTLTTLDKCGIYQLKSNNVTAGFLLVTSDNMSHGISQWLIGNYSITDGVVDGVHRDGTYSICVRTYPYTASATGEALQWTEWSYLLDSTAQYSYPASIRWSGVIVNMVSVEQSGASYDDPADVVFDMGHNSFLYKHDNKYYSEWSTRSDYQSNINTIDSELSPYFANKLFVGDNGVSLLPISKDKVIQISGQSQGSAAAIAIAGVFAGSEDDIVSGSTDSSSKWYFLKRLGCFGLGKVTENTAMYNNYSSEGRKSFIFTGKTNFSSEETPAGFTFLQGAILPVDGGIYEINGRGIKWEMHTLGGDNYPFAVANPLFKLDVGDCLMNDGTFMFREQAVMDYTDSIAGVIIDPIKGIMLPIPQTTIKSAFATSSSGTLNTVNAIKDILSSFTSCVDYEKFMSGLEVTLGGSPTSYEDYFPAFYEAKYSERNGYKHYLATSAECEFINNDERINEVLNELQNIPSVFYGVTPRITIGSLTSITQLSLVGETSAAAITATSNGDYLTLALYNE